MQELARSLADHPWAWGAVVGLGAFHGLNPGMGWLFAVSAGMQARDGRAVFVALGPIAAGHFLAMAVALLPFVLLGLYLAHVDEIRIGAALLLIAFGLYTLLSRRHPRFLARIGPTQITLWSFLMASAHGAGLMLVPVVLGLCSELGDSHGAHLALSEIASASLSLSLAAAAIHTIVMVATGGLIAWVVYRYLGLALLGRSWFNVDVLWGTMLVAVGASSLSIP